MKFLGIDLGWQSGASGLCCLTWQDDALHIKDLTRLDDIQSVLSWIDVLAPESDPALVAVDAPTLIPNEGGMRLTERLAHRYFGRYHAGCYPANLGRPFAQRTVSFSLSLEGRQFAHAPTIQAQMPGRYQIEVFPHAAMVNLFNLPRILKYKKGKLAERRAELTRLHQLILTKLSVADPPLNVSPLAALTIPERGAALKHLEDRLDSLICAYVAAHWWHWGKQRNWVLGDRAAGYIVVPVPNGSPPTQAS